MSRLKVCMLSSEMMPFAKTGGLADGTGALCAELASRKFEVRAFMPLHSSVRSAPWEFKPVAALQSLPMTLGTHRYVYSVQAAQYPGTELPVYFIDCPVLFDRP